MNQSGQQIAKENIAKFQSWVAERWASNDWQDYLRGGKLNRSEIAAECTFAKSVLQQNPVVKQALQDLEAQLESRGIIHSQTTFEASIEAAGASAMAIDKRVMAAKSKAEARVKALEEQNAALKAEVCDLREQLRHYDHLDDHLGRTGRLLPA